MTYANDVIEIQQRIKRRTLKRIEEHSDKELNAAIDLAVRKYGEDFYTLLHGIDAYMERRSRRKARRKLRASNAWLGMLDHVGNDDVWGNT